MEKPFYAAHLTDQQFATIGKELALDWIIHARTPQGVIMMVAYLGEHPVPDLSADDYQLYAPFDVMAGRGGVVTQTIRDTPDLIFPALQSIFLDDRHSMKSFLHAAYLHFATLQFRPDISPLPADISRALLGRLQDARPEDFITQHEKYHWAYARQIGVTLEAVRLSAPGYTQADRDILAELGLDLSRRAMAAYPAGWGAGVARFINHMASEAEIGNMAPALRTMFRISHDASGYNAQEYQSNIRSWFPRLAHLYPPAA